MATVNEILSFLETLAPKYMKMDWDNVGLLCGEGSKEVNKLLVALDPFPHVCDEAADWGADLLVTHHPLIFRPAKSVTDETATGRSIIRLIRSGICAINAHTNLDCAPGGVNDVLAKKLGLQEIAVLNSSGTDEKGSPWGLLRAGRVNETALEDFLQTVKAALGCQGLRYVSGGKKVNTVAVGGGACADALYEVSAAGCDTFVTSDIKYNQFWDAKELGLNLIDAGHFYTENPVTEYLAQQLQAAFPEVAVRISESHADCMKFYC